jgi:hypothetical protein
MVIIPAVVVFKDCQEANTIKAVKILENVDRLHCNNLPIKDGFNKLGIINKFNTNVKK